MQFSFGLLVLAVVIVATQALTAAEKDRIRAMQKNNRRSMTADEKFLSCCKRHRGVDSGCYEFCNYRSFNQDTLTKIFLAQTSCNRDKIGSYLWCLGSGHDHTPCCDAKNVHTTSAGRRCSQFCDLTPGTRFSGIDMAFWPCWERLNQIGTCYREHKEGL